MNTIILVADKEGIGADNHPQCFTETVDNISLVEYQVRMLRLLKIKPSEIKIVTGKEGSWKDDKYHSLVRKINASEMVIAKSGGRSYRSLKEVVEQLPELDDMLVLNGNRYFELREIELLLKNSNETSALVEKRNILEGKQFHALINKGYIENILPNARIDKLPWFSFYGALFLKKADVEKIKISSTNENGLSYIESIINNLKIPVRAYDISSDNSSKEWGWQNSTDLCGGSFAGLAKSILVKKVADRDGSEKLINEIKWLESVPKEIKHKFPVVIDSNLNGDSVWYTMPWYSQESLRKKILTGKVGEEYILQQVERILDFMWNEIYSRKSIVCPEDWVEVKHYNRFRSRLRYLEKIKPFKDIITVKSVFINNAEFDNLPILYEKIQNITKEKGILLKPDSLCMIHGDLHFQNMLVDEELDGFILADPRGELEGGDIYYDLGKLWHSVNGKYDLIHTDIASTQLHVGLDKNINLKVDFGPKYLIESYDRIKTGLEKIITKYPIAQDPNHLTKIKLSEFMHFSSLMYFHLKNDSEEARALTIYAQAILLGKKLLDEIRGLK